MATLSAQMTYDAYNATNLQQWVTTFVNSMKSVTGWLQTNDTGQVNSSTITCTNNGFDTAYGYQVYTFTDALTATNPLYVKFEFGAGQNFNNACPGIWVTVGTGTNGAGILTGQVSQRLELSIGTSNQGSNLYTSYFSGASNRFACALWDSINQTVIISIERSKDSTGNDNADGFIFHVASNRNGVYQQFVPSTGTILVAMPFWMGAFSYYSTMAVNNLVGLTFPTPFCAVPYNSGYNLAVSNGTDIPMYNQVIGTIYGNSHTYLQLQYNNGINLIPVYQAGAQTGGGQSPYNNNQPYYPPVRPLIRYD